MTCNDIYDIVAALIDENSAPDSGLLRSRAVRLINAAAIGLHELDCAIRRYTLGEVDCISALTLSPVMDLGDDFPLCGGLISACAYYVAMMSIRDENPALAASFLLDYNDAVKTAALAIPAFVTTIHDYYA